MGDHDGLPHEGLRTAIFWILFASWSLYFGAFWLDWSLPGPAPIEMLLGIGSALAGITSAAYLFGKFMFQDTQRELVRKTTENHRRIRAIYDALAAVGVTKKEIPALRLVPADRPGDQDKSG